MMYRTVLWIMFLFLMTACGTYQTFYGVTETNVIKKEKVYRLNLSAYKGVLTLKNHSDLRVLNLSNQQHKIDDILKSIPNPELLEVLILENNQLSILPGSISRFKNLKQLSLNNNPKLDYQQAIEVLKSNSKLEFLNLQFNQLQLVPNKLKELNTLEEINLSNNHLQPEYIFEPLAKLPKLRSLWIRNNQLTTLGDDVNEMKQLVNLYVEHNQLAELPNVLSGLDSLRILHLSFNSFTILPESLTTAPKLILLHADNCNITKIPTIFAEEKNIKGIVINNNRLPNKAIEFWKQEFSNFFLLIF